MKIVIKKISLMYFQYLYVNIFIIDFYKRKCDNNYE